MEDDGKLVWRLTGDKVVIALLERVSRVRCYVALPFETLYLVRRSLNR